jgi:hypothetical protein
MSKPFDNDNMLNDSSLQLTVLTTPFTLADDGYSVESESTNHVDVLGEDPPRNFFEWVGRRSGPMVMSQLFKRIILGLILLNCILLGVRTFDVIQHNDRALKAFNGLAHGFLVLFTLEFAVESLHYQHKIFTMGWAMFDLGVLVLSWCFTPTLCVLKSFRLLRALRKATGCEAISLPVKALLRALPQMLSIVLLLVVTFYIFAVLFTDLFQGLYEAGALSTDYFGRIDKVRGSQSITTPFLQKHFSF